MLAEHTQVLGSNPSTGEEKKSLFIAKYKSVDYLNICGENKKWELQNYYKKKILKFCSLFCFQKQSLALRPGCPGTYNNSPVSASQVLEL